MNVTRVALPVSRNTLTAFLLCRRGCGRRQAFSFTDPVVSPQLTLVKAIHVAELRAALDDVYTAAGMGPRSYTDPTLTVATTPIRAVHLEELRLRAQRAMTAI